MGLPRRAVLFVVASITATSFISITQTPNAANASTNQIWLNTPPNGQRLAGAAVSGNGEIGFVASSHSNNQYPANETATVWRTTNYGSQWVALANFPLGSWEAVATSNDGQRVVVLGTKAASATKSVMISMDRGDSWTDKPLSGSATVNDVDITPNGLHIALATSEGIFLSRYDGTTWTDWVNNHSTFTFPSDQTPSTLDLSRVVITNNTDVSAFQVHAIHQSSRVYMQNHDGQQGVTQSSWTPQSANLLSDIAASDNGSTVIVGSGGSADTSATIFISDDDGDTWTNQSTTNQTNGFVSVAVSGDGSRCLVAGYGNPLLESTCTSSSTWVATSGVVPQPWLALAVSINGSYLIGGTEKYSSSSVYVQMDTPAPAISNLQYRDTTSNEVVYAPATGGGTLVINGQYFYDVLSITIGGTAVPSFTRENDSVISLELPAGSPGIVDVVVTSEHGQGTLTGVLQYYALVAPTVTSVSRSSGSFLGNTEVTFIGDGLAEVSEVRIGNRRAQIGEQSRLQLTIWTPENRIGLMNITMTSALGTLVINDAWTSTWQSRSIEPEWSTFDGSSTSPVDYGGNETGVSAIIPDDENGFYVFGNFEEMDGVRGADFAAHWNGSSWNPIGEDGNGWSVFSLGGSPSRSLFGGQGILTATRTTDGSIWVGGEFEVDGEPANIARTSPPYTDWWVPSVVPNRRVTSITPVGNDVIVGGDFDAIAGVPTSSRIARLSPSETGTWSGLGSDGSGGSAIFGDGLLSGSINRTVQSVLSNETGSIFIGGSFRLPSTTTGHDILAEFNGSTWRSILHSTEKEVVSSLQRGVLNGVETIVVGMCAQESDSSSIRSGRIVTIVGETVTNIASFNGCVRDVDVVGDAIVAAGWFDNLVVDGVSTTALRNLALFHDSTWQNLGARAELDNVLVYDDYSLAVSTYQTDSRIGRIDGAEYLARYGPLTELIGRNTTLGISNISAVRAGDNVNVTVTGTNYSSELEATLDGRPVENLEITTPDTLRFTAPWSDLDRSLIIYGRTETISRTLSPPRTPDPPLESQTITPSLPSTQSIRALPTAKLFTTKKTLSPNSSLRVAANGFVGGEEVWIILASTPRRLASATVNGDGTVSHTIKLPSNFAGKHTLVVWSPTTGRGVRQTITILVSVKAKKTKTVSSILKANGISVPKKSKISVSIHTRKTCRLNSRTVVRGISKGICRISVKISPPKGKSSTKKISLSIT